ncbi:MAG: TRAM domain-containing protein [Rubrobacteridae bacterium]|nr:TRAM domain-containing protein [Rubrobacteridae bacterium]
MLQLIRVVFIVTGAIGAYELIRNLKLPDPFAQYDWAAIIICVILGAAVGYVLGGVIGRRLLKTLNWLEGRIQKLPTSDLLLALAGLVAGLVIAWLISIPFGYIKIPFLQFTVAMFSFAIFGYLGVRIALRKREDMHVFMKNMAEGRGMNSGGSAKFDFGASKLLDTSVIIDGRIADVAKTGFLEGTLTVPRFVLRELQMVADSEDSLKRNRGRRGLDILKTLQNEPNLKLEILERDFPDLADVDAKLVRLGGETKSAVLTNDYNLNKVAELQGVQVLNLNDLANALKPVVLPGEEMLVGIIREGKEAGQGVGYLDDGTMVVVDGGGVNVGREVDIMVTSVLQTPAGRMIFGRMKDLHGRQR